MEDYEIIQKCIAGDKQIFEELVNRYKNLVYSVILRMTNNIDDANDLAQEVFIKVYRNLDKYSPEYKFSTWIIRITTNQVIDYRRKQKAPTLSMDDMIYEPIAEGTPEEDYIQQEEKKQVEKILNGLPDMYRIPLVLYHQQGLSYQEIADAIEEPLSKVKNRIFRARRMIKEDLLAMKEGELYEM